MENDDTQQLDEISVASRNRFPGVAQRARDAKSTLSPGTMFPRLAAILNPTLYRERLDTNDLMGQVFGEGGELADLARDNPTLVQSIRDKAEQPMSPQEHEQFRSAIVGMVGQEYQKQQKIQTTLADNSSFMEAFSMMDSALPGARDPEMQTYEEAERKQIGVLYQQAQRMAQIDPDGSKDIMADVRKRADALTSNTRELMDKTRKRATLEDIALYSASDNAMQALKDASEDLNKAIASGKQVPEFVLQKALTAYGAASALQSTSLGDVAGAAINGTATGAGTGAAGGPWGAVAGGAVGALTTGTGKLVDYFKDKKKVQQLADALHDAGAQVATNYNNNRSKLQQRYAPLGIKFGEQQGEVYAVVKDAYDERASNIPEKSRSADEVAQDKEATLRQMLTDEHAGAEQAVQSARPEASANMPKAQQRMELALERRQNAADDLSIFNADMSEARGVPVKPEQAADIKAARSRRESRLRASRALQAQKAIADSLRSFTR